MEKNSYTNILIEGPDCSGKSTVVERLKNMLRWDSKSLHHRPGSQFQRYLKEYVHQEKVVFDRGHISECVYGQLWHRCVPFSNEEKTLLDSLCKKQILIIFACPHIDLMKNRYKKRDFAQQIKLKELEITHSLFCEAFENIPHIVYTSKNFEELDELLKKIKRMVKR